MQGEEGRQAPLRAGAVAVAALVGAGVGAGETLNGGATPARQLRLPFAGAGRLGGDQERRASDILRQSGGEGRARRAAQADHLMIGRVSELRVDGRAPQGGEGAAQHVGSVGAGGAGGAGGAVGW